MCVVTSEESDEGTIGDLVWCSEHCYKSESQLVRNEIAAVVQKCKFELVTLNSVAEYEAWSLHSFRRPFALLTHWKDAKPFAHASAEGAAAIPIVSFVHCETDPLFRRASAWVKGLDPKSGDVLVVSDVSQVASLLLQRFGRTAIAEVDVCAEMPLTQNTMMPSAVQSRSSTVHHLVVLQHGLGGQASDWSFFGEKLREHNTGAAWSDEVESLHHFTGPAENVNVIFWAASHKNDDGVAATGDRVAEGILLKQDEYRKLGQPIKYVSAIGHSMGGLFLRYAFKALYEKGVLSNPACTVPHREHDLMELRSFFTIASPHLSVWRPGLSLVDSIFNRSTSAISNQSIKEISLNDAKFQRGADSGKQPLLYRMATEEAFTKPLGLFKRGVLYANVFGDLQIPYESGSIQKYNPYKGSAAITLAEKDERYPHIVSIDGESSLADEKNDIASPRSRHNFGKSLRLHFCHACKKPTRNRGCQRCARRFCEDCYMNTHKICEQTLFASGKEPYWLMGETGIGDMYNGLSSITFDKAGWEHCDVNIDGALSMHLSHWLIAGIPKGKWHVKDPAMHIMHNLISGDDHIKYSDCLHVLIDADA